MFGGAKGFVREFPSLYTWGVVTIVSSPSTWSIKSSSSELVLPESESSMLRLPIEPDTATLSVFATVDQSELEMLTGDSSRLDGLERPFRGGIIMPFPPMVGEESGDDCSANVE